MSLPILPRRRLPPYKGEFLAASSIVEVAVRPLNYLTEQANWHLRGSHQGARLAAFLRVPRAPASQGLRSGRVRTRLWGRWLDLQDRACQTRAVDTRDRAGKSDSLTAEQGSRGSERLAERPGEPPVVARLVVEIRSDGSHTIARGAMEDALSGQKVAVEASGTTPLALALSLAKSIVATPLLARQAFRALVSRRR